MRPDVFAGLSLLTSSVAYRLGQHSFVPYTYEGFHKQKQTPQPIAKGFLSMLVA